MSRRRSALVALMLGAALALGGCGGSDEERAEDAIEEAAEEAGEDVDVDVDGDDITIENSDGTVSMGGDLPEGFPEDDIPLVEGEVLLAMGGEGQGWQVSLAVDSSAEDAMAEARGLLEGAGFSVDEEAVMGEMSTATFSSDAYNVYVTAAEADGQTSLIYAIENL
jgi:hypothetical protein